VFQCSLGIHKFLLFQILFAASASCLHKVKNKKIESYVIFEFIFTKQIFFLCLRWPAANLLLKQGYQLGNTASSTKFSSRKNDILLEVVVTYVDNFSFINKFQHIDRQHTEHMQGVWKILLKEIMPIYLRLSLLTVLILNYFMVRVTQFWVHSRIIIQFF
jgi:hypothetical protein